jgi:hypothetical protein
LWRYPIREYPRAERLQTIDYTFSVHIGPIHSKKALAAGIFQTQTNAADTGKKIYKGKLVRAF